MIGPSIDIYFMAIPLASPCARTFGRIVVNSVFRNAILVWVQVLGLVDLGRSWRDELAWFQVGLDGYSAWVLSSQIERTDQIVHRGYHSLFNPAVNRKRYG